MIAYNHDYLSLWGDKMQENSSVIERIVMAMAKRGVSKGWIAEQLQWPPSKISKIFSGSQKLTTDELIEIAFVLNENPALFISADLSEIRSKYPEVRDLPSIFSDIYTNRESPDELVRYFEVLLPNAVEYLTKSYEEGRVVESIYRYKRIYKHKDGKKANAYIPNPRVVVIDNNCGHVFGKQFSMGYWFTTDKQKVYLAIHSSMQDEGRVDDKSNRFRIDMQQIFRSFIKDIVNDEDDFEFAKVDFDKRSAFAKGVIFCKRYALSDIPSEVILRQDLMKMYDNYLKFLDFLSRHVTNTYQSVVEEKYVLSNANLELSSGYYYDDELDRTESVRLAKRNIELMKEAAERENYICEFDDRHSTFIDRRSKKPYIEVVSLIPAKILEQEGMNDVSENMICLCPNCKAKLSYSDDSLREEMLLKLYMKHKESLKEQGVEISMMQLLKWNNLG